MTKYSDYEDRFLSQNDKTLSPCDNQQNADDEMQSEFMLQRGLPFDSFARGVSVLDS